MPRIVVIGNSGGGKSTLARKLAARRRVPYHEIDRFLWCVGWQLVPAADYETEHARVIASKDWLLDGIGSRESIPARLQRATEIILVDLPLWVHFWLAAERQIAYATGTITDPPAGQPTMPPTEGLFRNIWTIAQEWMPEIRQLIDAEATRGKAVTRLVSLAAMNEFA
jgi:hypothetical protein